MLKGQRMYSLKPPPTLDSVSTSRASDEVSFFPRLVSAPCHKSLQLSCGHSQFSTRQFVSLQNKIIHVNNSAVLPNHSATNIVVHSSLANSQPFSYLWNSQVFNSHSINLLIYYNIILHTIARLVGVKKQPPLQIHSYSCQTSVSSTSIYHYMLLPPRSSLARISCYLYRGYLFHA